MIEIAIGTVRPAPRAGRTSAALPLLLAAAVLLAAGCGAGQDGGEEGPPPDTTTAAADTAAPADSPTAPADGPAEEADSAAEAADSVAPSPDTAPAVAEEPAADTADRRWQPGGYLVYLRSGESPDSVAAAHGVEPDTVLAGLPGFYARLTADQAGALALDERVRELARQLEERPMPEPRGMPTGGGDTTGGG